MTTENGAWSVVIVVPRGIMLLAQARHFNTKDLNFPGGNAAPEDRNAPQTAVRELLEETGLVVKEPDLQLIDTWTGDRGQPVYAYLVTRYRGRPRSSSEGKVFWTKQYASLMTAHSTFAAHNARIIRKLLEIRPAA